MTFPDAAADLRLNVGIISAFWSPWIHIVAEFVAGVSDVVTDLICNLW